MMRVLRSGILFLAVMYSVAIFASAADDITVLIISAIVNTGPLSFGLRSFFERNICAPTWLQAFDSLRKPASMCAAKILSVFEKLYHRQVMWQHNLGVVLLHLLFPQLLLIVERQRSSRLLGFYC